MVLGKELYTFLAFHFQPSTSFQPQIGKKVQINSEKVILISENKARISIKFFAKLKLPFF